MNQQSEGLEPKNLSTDPDDNPKDYKVIIVNKTDSDIMTNSAERFYQDKRIFAIQKSTRTRIPFFQRLNEKLRLRFKWYYNLRLDPKYLYPNIDDQLSAIQRSTRTNIKTLLPLHNKLRQISPWYYNWHIRPISHKVHWATLGTFIIFAALEMALILYGHPQEKIKAAAEFTCTFDGSASSNWADAANWDADAACNGEYPGQAAHSYDVVIPTTKSVILDVSGKDLTNGGTGGGSASITGTLNTNGNTITILSVTINSGGTLTAGSSTINVKTNWDNINGTFTPNTSTVNFTDTGTINVGATAYAAGKPFYNITVAASTKTTTLDGGGVYTETATIGAGAIASASGTKDLVLTGSGTSLTNSANGTITSVRMNFYPIGDGNIPAATNYYQIYVHNRGGAGTNPTSYLLGDVTASNYVYLSGNANSQVTLDLNGYDFTSSTIFIGQWWSEPSTSVAKIMNSSEIFATLESIGYIMFRNGSTTYFDPDNTIDGTNMNINFTGSNGQCWDNNDDANSFQANNSTVTVARTYVDASFALGTGTTFNDFVVNHTGASGSDDVNFYEAGLDIDGKLTITDGDLDLVTNNPNAAIGGGLEFTHATNGSLTRGSGTLTFDGDGTWTDAGSSKRDIGAISIDGTDADLALGSSVKASTITIGADDDLSLSASSYELEIDGDGATATILTVNGTLTPGTSTVKYSATNSGGNVNITTTTYNSLKLSGADTYDLTNNLTTTNALTGDLTIDAGATLSATASNYNITLAGSWSNSGTFTAGTSTITFNGTASGKTIKTNNSAFSTLTINGSGGYWTQDTNNLTAATLTVTAGTFATAALNLTVTGTTTLNGGDLVGGAGTMNLGFDGVTNGTGSLTISNASSDFTASATVNIKTIGSYTRSAGTANWTTNSSTFNYQEGDGNSIVIPLDTFYNLNLSDDGDGVLFDLSSGTTTVNGNLAIADSNYCYLSVGNGNTLTVLGNVTIGTDVDGVLYGNSGTINVGGNWTISGGLFSAGTSTVNFTGNASAHQTVTTNGQAFNNLTINNDEATYDDIIISGTLDVNGLLTITDGDLDLNTNDPDTTLGGGLTFSHATNGSLTRGSGTLTFDGAGTWTDNGTDKRDIGNVSGTATVTLGSSVKATDALMTSLDITGYSITITGSSSMRPLDTTTLTYNASSEIIYTSSSADTIRLPEYTNPSVTINGASGLTLKPEIEGTEPVIEGDLTITSGIFSTKDADMADRDLTINGNLNLGASGVLTANSSDISVAGNWSNSGTFTAGTSTVIFDGVSTSIVSGSTTFNNLTMDTNADGAKQINFTAGTTQTIGSTWTLDGASGKVLTLRSTSDDSQWYFDLPSAMTSGDYIDVQDSWSADANKITTGDYATVTNSGNNDGWIWDVNLSFSLSSNTVTFDNLNSGNGWTNTKTTIVNTTTTAKNGYVVRAYAAQALTSLAYPARTIPHFVGTWATPELWPGGTYGFGYTSSDTSVQGSNRFATSTKYAAFTQTLPGDVVADNTVPVTNEQFTIQYKVAVSGIQSASSYSTTITYIATANY